jgi:hypothetical protein
VHDTFSQAWQTREYGCLQKMKIIFFVGKLAALTRRTPNCFPKLYALLVLLLFIMQLVLRVLLERPQLLQHLHRKSKQPKWTIMIPDLETVRYHQSTPYLLSGTT